MLAGEWCSLWLAGLEVSSCSSQLLGKFYDFFSPSRPSIDCSRSAQHCGQCLQQFTVYCGALNAQLANSHIALRHMPHGGTHRFRYPKKSFKLCFISNLATAQPKGANTVGYDTTTRFMRFYFICVFLSNFCRVFLWQRQSSR